MITRRVSNLLRFRVLSCIVFPVVHDMRLKKQYLSGNEKSYMTLSSLVYFINPFHETLKVCLSEMRNVI